MKSRLVVGPPPIKYVKKYSKGGALTGFQKAFAEARKEKGKDQVFLYKGKQYSTNYKEEGYPKVTPKLTDKPTTQAKPTPETRSVQSQQQVETLKRSMLAELQSIGGTRQGGSITSPTPKIGVTTKPVEEKKVPRESMDVSKLPTSNARSVSSTTRRPAEKLKSAPPVPVSKLAKAPVEQTQASAPVETDDDWIRTIMQFEATKGSKEGKGLPNFGYNTAAPKDIDEAVKLYKKEYLPKVANLPRGMRERFGDFLYNSGENLWLYMTHLNRLNKGEGGVQDRSKYRVKGGQEGKPGERYQYLEQDFAKDISEISKLPIEEQTKLADQARDWYYKNINTTGGKPSPTYEKSWKYRVGMFNQPEKKMYGGSLPKKQLGGMANVGSTEQAGLGLLTTGLSAIPGVGAILSPIVGALGSAFLGNKQQKDSFNRQYSNIQVMEKGGKLKSDPPTKRGSLVYPSGYAPTVTGYPTASPAPNYSKAKSFNDAFSKARAAGESSFRYNNKIYSTKKDTDDIKLTPEVIKMYGDVNKILNKEYPELKKLLNRGTPVNKLQYIKDRASWFPSGINVGKTRLGKDEDPTSMLDIFNLPAELAHHEQFTNLPIVKRMLKFASGVKERLKYGDPGMYYKKGTIENEAHGQWQPAIELTARGNLTPEYIKQVQKKLGFTGKDVDGILGPKTYGKLVSAAGLSKKVLDNFEGRGDMLEGTDVLPKILKTMQNMVDMGSLQKTTSSETFIPEKAKGGMIKRKDGSYSRRGLWDNIRANKGSGKKPTKEMLEQERKIKAKMEFGGMLTGKSDLSFYKGRKHANGGIMVSSKGTPSNKPVAEVEGGETRFKLGSNAYIFSDKLTL